MGTPEMAQTGFARIARSAMLAIALCTLAACATVPPPPAPAPEPTLHERQVKTLRTLGFEEADDGWLMSIAEPISFEFNNAALRDDLGDQLGRFADDLLAVDLRTLRVEGHTDHLGERQYNEQLSLRRAEAVAAVFIARGFDAGKVIRRGMASDFPIASTETREGRAANRRVSVIVPADSMAPTSP